tara:strand:+ start:8754 stop:9041 length:288 start_codon:yes stop_codon:yes gene_type:complete
MAGALNVFTKSMTAGSTLTIAGGDGVKTITVLCTTDNSAAGGVTITGTLTVGGTAPDGLLLQANQSATISVPNPFCINALTIVTAAASTAKVIAS